MLGCWDENPEGGREMLGLKNWGIGDFHHACLRTLSGGPSSFSNPERPPAHRGLRPGGGTLNGERSKSEGRMKTFLINYFCGIQMARISKTGVEKWKIR
jgi:hypothetical protein